MKWLGKAFDGAIDVMGGLSILSIIFITGAIVYQVLIRFTSGGAVIWVNDVTEYVILGITFLGGPYVLREKAHIEVDILIARLERRKQLMVKTATSFVGAFICLILSWYSLELIWDLHQRGIPVVKTIEVSKALILSPIFLGSFFMMIQFLLNALEHHRTRRGLT